MMNIAEMGYFFEQENKEKIKNVVEQIRSLSVKEEFKNMSFYDAIDYISNVYKIKLTPNEEEDVFNLLFN